MIFNRSVPADALLAHIDYQDVDEAIAWLSRAFGFSEHYRYGNPVSGAQLHLGNAWVMVGRVKPGQSTPKQLGYGTQCLTIFVEDIQSHFQRAKSAGVVLLEELHETGYGELQYAAEDLDGHRWLFSRHARNMSPEQWGATVSQPATMPSQISPMLAVSDGSVAVMFYKAAFHAEVRWQLGAGPDIVAGLTIHGAPFFLLMSLPNTARATLPRWDIRPSGSNCLSTIPSRCSVRPLRRGLWSTAR